MFMMGALPVVDALPMIDGLCGRGHGSSIIDWYEAAWRLYEAECELEEVIEHELYLMRQELGLI
jgi:hypothetical protein